MKTNWLWDTRLTETQVLKILQSPEHPRFRSFSVVLFSRVTDPYYVFKIFDRRTFCKIWPTVKKEARKDRASQTRENIKFWQEMYLAIHDEFQQKGIKIRQPKEKKKSHVLDKIAAKIRAFRQEKKWTQKQFAERIHVRQAIIPRIEKGQENFSITRLEKIAAALGKNIEINFR